tara:strand:+ start:4080 stop:4271 length:192 start_codon:yes stop_codon:yes gene_type:complete
MLNNKDLQIEVYTNISPIREMKITHSPTGEVAIGCGLVQSHLKKRLVKELERKINEQTESCIT